MTEAEILSYQNRLNTQIAHENLFDEIRRRKARELHGERKDYGGLNSNGAEPFHALLVGGETRRGGFWAQEFQRRGIEGQSGGGRAGFVGAFDVSAEDCLVAQMDAVVIADGQNAAAV